MGMSFSGYGRGKLLLFGEHAAVKGYPALGLSLQRGIRVSLEPAPAGHKQEKGGWILADRGENENAIARAVMKRIDEAVPGLPAGGLIRVTSDLPEGRGFGSSAAICVALAEAALAAAGTAEAIRHRNLVWAIAHHAEVFFHGRPSGIDTGLAALGGLIGFTPRPPELPEAHRIKGWPFHLLAGSVPRLDDAKTLIARVHEAAASEESPANATLRRLGQLAMQATELFSPALPAPETLGKLANEAEGELETLGLVAPTIKELLDLGIEGGALGGKMSGAGGGGAFWLVYADRGAAERGREFLERIGKEGGSWMGLELAMESFSA